MRKSGQKLPKIEKPRRGGQGQEHRQSDRWASQVILNGLLEPPAHEESGNGSQNQGVYQLRRGPLGPWTSPAKSIQELPTDLAPLLSKKDEQSQQRSDVQHYIESETPRAASEQPANQDQLGGAANGQKFRETLEDAEKHGLPNGKRDHVGVNSQRS